MADNIYHVYQMNSAPPTAYLTKSDGIEPIIQALRERRDSDQLLAGTAVPQNLAASSTTGTLENAGATLALIPQLILHYGQMLSTMADVR